MCGIFGALSKPGRARVGGHIPHEAMDIVRHRGSGLGGGFARTRAGSDETDWTLRACIDRDERADALRARLEEEGFGFTHDQVDRIEGGAMRIWTARAHTVPDDHLAICDRINQEHLQPGNLDARIISCSRRLDVWKDVAHPAAVATGHGLQDKHGDAWLGHTREPTNSPGKYPIWSHPFTMGDVAIVHNGDISSYGANMRWLRRRGYTSFTGTDSEVMAIILHHLLEVDQLSPEEAARAMIDPEAGSGDPALAGAALDGPFAVAATWSTAAETFLLVMVDRQKLRPLVLGEDEDAFYCASEEEQIRRVSPDARVWTPAPGDFFLASSERGLIRRGRDERRPRLDAAGVPEGTMATPARGARFLGAGYHRGQAAVLEGPVGNCLAGGLQGGVVVVHGNVGDDACDGMLSGRVVIHGNARDVAGQAMQGGVLLVRGAVGNRAALQMREYEDHDLPYRIEADQPPAGLAPNHPALIVGGGADDHLGEYMAGGVAIVLNLVEGTEGLTVEGAPSHPVGRFVGTGMVGGRIYIRGEVDPEDVGLSDFDEARRYLDACVDDGRLDAATRDDVAASTDPQEWLERLPPECHRATRFLGSKYAGRPCVTRRSLAPDDLALVARAIDSFCEAFEVAPDTRDVLLADTWTVVTASAPIDV